MTKEPKRGIPRRVQEIREDAWFTLSNRGSPEKSETPFGPLDLLVKHDRGMRGQRFDTEFTRSAERRSDLLRRSRGIRRTPWPLVLPVIVERTPLRSTGSSQAGKGVSREFAFYSGVWLSYSERCIGESA